eukprot:2604843-Prorocentrum_lima.AAC.1
MAAGTSSRSISWATAIQKERIQQQRLAACCLWPTTMHRYLMRMLEVSSLRMQAGTPLGT